MKCEQIVAKIQSGDSGLAGEEERLLVAEHVAGCRDCQDAIQGVEAAKFIRHQPALDPSPDLYERTMASVTRQYADSFGRRRGFWFGTGVGAAAAAALVAAAMALGFLRGPDTQLDDSAEFYVSSLEPRELNIAIDAETELRGATVSLTLYGGVELDGYASQRHLVWTTDLDAGVNKLTLPILALDDAGGQIIVRLDHPDSQQEFLVTLRHES